MPILYKYHQISRLKTEIEQQKQLTKKNCITTWPIDTFPWRKNKKESQPVRFGFSMWNLKSSNRNDIFVRIFFLNYFRYCYNNSLWIFIFHQFMFVIRIELHQFDRVTHSVAMFCPIRIINLNSERIEKNCA